MAAGAFIGSGFAGGTQWQRGSLSEEWVPAAVSANYQRTECHQRLCCTQLSIRLERTLPLRAADLPCSSMNPEWSHMSASADPVVPSPSRSKTEVLDGIGDFLAALEVPALVTPSGSAVAPSMMAFRRALYSACVTKPSSNIPCKLVSAARTSGCIVALRDSNSRNRRMADSDVR